MRIREYFLSVKSQLEEYNDELKTEVAAAKVELEEKDRHIARLSEEGEKRRSERDQVQVERDTLRTKLEALNRRMNKIKEKHDNVERAIESQELWDDDLGELSSSRGV